MIRQALTAGDVRRYNHWKPYPDNATQREATCDKANMTTDSSSQHAAPPRCSLVTVTYNSASTLEHFWTGFAGPHSPEWIVVDNASSDDTVAIARRLGARVITLPENRGFSHANNVGMAAARGDVIGFVNPDVRVELDAVHELAEVAVARRAVVGPQLFNADGSPQPNGRGFPTLIAKIRNRLRGDDAQYLLFASSQEPRPVVWLMGAAVFGRREDLSRFGAWDDRFFLYYEDSDIGLRSWNAGVPVLLVPTARMTHGWARETSGGFRLEPWRREIASMAKFYARYPYLLLGRAFAASSRHDIHTAVFPSSTANDRKDAL